MVLTGGGLHPEAVAELRQAQQLIDRSTGSIYNRRGRARAAREALERARAELIVEAR